MKYIVTDGKIKNTQTKEEIPASAYLINCIQNNDHKPLEWAFFANFAFNNVFQFKQYKEIIERSIRFAQEIKYLEE